MQNKKIGRPLQGRTGLFSRGNKYEKEEEEEEEEEEEVEEERSFTFYLCGSLFFCATPASWYLIYLYDRFFFFFFFFFTSFSRPESRSPRRWPPPSAGRRHTQRQPVLRFSLSLSLYLDFSFSFFFSPSFPFCRPYFFSPFYFVPSPRYFIPAASLRFGYQY